MDYKNIVHDFSNPYVFTIFNFFKGCILMFMLSVGEFASDERPLLAWKWLQQ